MAAVSCTLSEDQFLCSICLEVFSAPVTTPCGHSFCRACINEHWDKSDECNCPVCKQLFMTKPHLKVNIVLAEMVLEFKSNPQVQDVEGESLILAPESAADEVTCEEAAEPRRLSSPGLTAVDVNDTCAASEEKDSQVSVACDMCLQPRVQALKSCLVCLASYCQDHLQPHLTNPRLKIHQLIEAQTNLEERICPEHSRPLELFCKDHSHFICLECTSGSHKDHKAVPLKEECEVQHTQVKDEIRERLLKIAKIRSSLELSQKNADTEIQQGIEVFNVLKECIQQSLDSFKQDIEKMHKEREEDAAQIIEHIRKEISELEQRGADMEQELSSGDHLQFMQTFTTAKPAPQLQDWDKSKICVKYHRVLVEALSTLQKDHLRVEIKKVFVEDLKRFQQHAVNVTLNEDSAHENIKIPDKYSKNAKYVSTKEEGNKSFTSSTFHFVLGDRAFSSGKFYFEVDVSGSHWAVGVASESVQRRSVPMPRPWYGVWLLQWDSESAYYVGTYRRYYDHIPKKIGVFVHYEKCLVTFFDVDRAVLLGTINDCSFTGDILPLISPCKSGEGMTVTRVR